MKRKTLFLLIISLAMIVTAFCKGPGPVSTTSLPDVELVDLNGQKIELQSFSGKAVIVNFWATWCKPCRAEIPMLNDLHRKYQQHGLEIVGISTDDDGAKAVKEFTKEIPIHYNNLLKTPATEEKFGGIYAYPTSFFYDKNGNKIDVVLGVQPLEYFEKNIQRMLKQ